MAGSDQREGVESSDSGPLLRADPAAHEILKRPLAFYVIVINHHTPRIASEHATRPPQSVEAPNKRCVRETTSHTRHLRGSVQKNSGTLPTTPYRDNSRRAFSVSRMAHCLPPKIHPAHAG